MKYINVNDLSIGQHCIIVQKRTAGIFKVISPSADGDNNVLMQEITLDNNTKKYPLMSDMLLAVKPSKKVMPLRTASQAIP
jgi:hypothetical protein